MCPASCQTLFGDSHLILTKISVTAHFTEKKTETQIEWWTCWATCGDSIKVSQACQPLCCLSDQSYFGWLPAHQWFADMLKSTFLLPRQLGCSTSARFSSESIYALLPCASHLLVRSWSTCSIYKHFVLMGIHFAIWIPSYFKDCSENVA